MSLVGFSFLVYVRGNYPYKCSHSIYYKCVCIQGLPSSVCTMRAFRNELDQWGFMLLSVRLAEGKATVPKLLWL